MSIANPNIYNVVKEYSGSQWTPNTQWEQIGIVQENTIEFVTSDKELFLGFIIATQNGGNILVDWGDGVQNEYLNNATAHHTYTKNSGTYCNDGYTTFKGKISCIAPYDKIVTFTTAASENNAILSTNETNGLLWIVFNTPELYTFTFTSNEFFNVFHRHNSRHLECVILPDSLLNYIAQGEIPFLNCTNLKKIGLPLFWKQVEQDVFAGHNFSNFFSNLYSLLEVDFRGAEIPVTHYSTICSGCSLLERFISPKVVSTTPIYSNLFSNCYSLKEIVFLECTGGYPSTMNFLSGSFNNLETLIFTNWTTTKVMVQSAFKLKTFIPPTSLAYGASPPTYVSLPLITEIVFPIKTDDRTINLDSMCNANSNLKRVVLPDFSKATSLVSTFFRNYNLEEIVGINTLGDTTTAMNFSTTFAECYSLTTLNIHQKMNTKFVLAGNENYRAKLNSLIFTNPSNGNTWTGASPQIDVAYCSMDATALNNLFTSIIATSTTFSGKTIRISGNPGADTCDTTIITNAGGAIM